MTPSLLMMLNLQGCFPYQRRPVCSQNARHAWLLRQWVFTWVKKIRLSRFACSSCFLLTISCLRKTGKKYNTLEKETVKLCRQTANNIAGFLSLTWVKPLPGKIFQCFWIVLLYWVSSCTAWLWEHSLGASGSHLTHWAPAHLRVTTQETEINPRPFDIL